jgi:hypothetical protein
MHFELTAVRADARRRAPGGMVPKFDNGSAVPGNQQCIADPSDFVHQCHISPHIERVSQCLA